jgi:hypothetical protein
MEPYYVTPYENGCIIERDGEGTISIHKEEVTAIRRACDLAAAAGAEVMVRRLQSGRCRPYCEPAPSPAREPEKLGWRERVKWIFNPMRFI